MISSRRKQREEFNSLNKELELFVREHEGLQAGHGGFHLRYG